MGISAISNIHKINVGIKEYIYVLQVSKYVENKVYVILYHELILKIEEELNLHGFTLVFL